VAKRKVDKEKLQLGQKARAGRMISELIRYVGNEKTEIADVYTDPDTCEKKIISKAEAMVRDMWKEALEGEDAKVRLENRKILINRIEGKPEDNQEETGKKKMSVPDRISDINRKKLNQMATYEKD